MAVPKFTVGMSDRTSVSATGIKVRVAPRDGLARTVKQTAAAVKIIERRLNILTPLVQYSAYVRRLMKSGNDFNLVTVTELRQTIVSIP